MLRLRAMFFGLVAALLLGVSPLAAECGSPTPSCSCGSAVCQESGEWLCPEQPTCNGNGSQCVYGQWQCNFQGGCASAPPACVGILSCSGSSWSCSCDPALGNPTCNLCSADGSWSCPGPDMCEGVDFWALCLSDQPPGYCTAADDWFAYTLDSASCSGSDGHVTCNWVDRLDGGCGDDVSKVRGHLSDEDHKYLEQFMCVEFSDDDAVAAAAQAASETDPA